MFRDAKWTQDFNNKFNPKKSVNIEKVDKQVENENSHFDNVRGENNKSVDFRKDQFHWKCPWEENKHLIRNIAVIRGGYKPECKPDITHFLQKGKKEKIVPEYFKKQISITRKKRKMFSLEPKKKKRSSSRRNFQRTQSKDTLFSDSYIDGETGAATLKDFEKLRLNFDDIDTY